MAEENVQGTPDAQGAEGKEPQGKDHGSAFDGMDQTTLAKTAAKLQDEAAQNRIAAREAREALEAMKAQMAEAQTAAERAKMDELQRAQAEAADWRAKAEAAQESAKNALIRSALVSEATAIGPWHSLDAALKLVDLTGVSVSSDGTVTGAKEAIAGVAAAHSYMIAKPVAPAPSAGPAPVKGPLNGLSEEKRKAMAALYPETRSALGI